ncbi:UV-damaged DNA-binding protein rad7, partial [Rhizina undulata]
MNRICQIISRNRYLNNSTIKLFIDPGITGLTLYDCSKIDVSELKSIAAFVPTIQSLSLRFCGRITDDVLDYTSRLSSLKSLELRGPFLITKACYERFFEARRSQLESFSISDSLRVDIDVITALNENCPDLTELRLHIIGKLDDNSARLLKDFQKLRVLEISSPSYDISNVAIGEVLNSVGSGLRKLSLPGCGALTDTTAESIHACCDGLHSLNFEECELITDSGIKKLFRNWNKNIGLSRLNPGRAHDLRTEGLLEVLNHSGKILEYLNMNSCTKLDADALQGFVEKAEKMTRLEELYVGFVRAVDDLFVEGVGKACAGLRVVKVYGASRVTAICGGNALIVGREADPNTNVYALSGVTDKERTELASERHHWHRDVFAVEFSCYSSQRFHGTFNNRLRWVAWAYRRGITFYPFEPAEYFGPQPVRASNLKSPLLLKTGKTTSRKPRAKSGRFTQRRGKLSDGEVSPGETQLSNKQHVADDGPGANQMTPKASKPKRCSKQTIGILAETPIVTGRLRPRKPQAILEATSPIARRQARRRRTPSIANSESEEESEGTAIGSADDEDEYEE